MHHRFIQSPVKHPMGYSSKMVNISSKMAINWELRDFQKQPLKVFYKKAVLKNFAIFTVKHLRWSLLFAGCLQHNFIKKRLQHRCFPVNIAKYLRTPFLKKICERLLLDWSFPEGPLQDFFQKHHIDSLETTHTFILFNSFFTNIHILSGTARYNLCGNSLPANVKCRYHFRQWIFPFSFFSYIVSRCKLLAVY